MRDVQQIGDPFMDDSQVLTVAQMKAGEQALFDRGIGEGELMDIAGTGAAEWVWRIAAGRPVTVLCGPGNNGGDGYVIARVLQERGLEVQVVAPMAPTTATAKAACELYKGTVLTSGSDACGEVLVDCLFGSGLSRPLSAELVVMLLDLSERHSFTIAVDMPSGVESDSGALLNDRLPPCDLTLALGAWKFAHWRLPARTMMGVQQLVPMGIAPVPEAARLIEQPRIPDQPADAHKYTRGLCAVVGGVMPGASILSAKAAMRSGAGYVKLLSDRAAGFTKPAGLVVSDADLSSELTDQRINALLVGPGLGRDEDALERLNAVSKTGKPCVLDADALQLLAPQMIANNTPRLATPHDGELDALCRTFGIVASGRQAKAQALAKASGMVVLAKGPDTVIAAPDGQLALARPATPWLSVAGSGDVLAGIAASRMATGVQPFEAACQAVWLHGKAAQLCSPAFTADGLAAMTSNALSQAIFP